MTLSLRFSDRAQLSSPSAFLWCTGIEDTFITEPFPGTGRTLDEYELTQHYERWYDDLGLMAELNVSAARYGLPWHRINPAPGVWRWEWADAAIERLLSLKIQPIIDLVHYGLPRWIEGAFLHPEFPEFMAEYARRVAERYKGRVFAYTPLNEPRITAWYCGRIGWWPPFQRSWRGFVSIMLAVSRGIVRTVQTLRGVDPEIFPVHVDATDLYFTDEETLKPDVELRQELVFFCLDLISGRIRPGHSLWDWLLRHGMTQGDAEWFGANALTLPLIGINLYPMFTQKLLQRSTLGRLRVKMPYAQGLLVTELGQRYWKRYQSPLFISETASVGTVKRRRAWLDDSIAAVHALRESGIPLVGYTWWPLFALVTWAYRQGTKPPSFYLKQMGLWNLNESLERIPTSLVECYRDYTSRRVGAIALPSKATRITS